MIHPSSFSHEWIKSISGERKLDPILVEKMIRALHLLEQLQLSGAKFIFKGGTALSLLLDSLGRLSIDIDIIMPEKPENPGKYFDTIIENSDFLNYKASERAQKSNIDKAHYKFFYAPVAKTKGGQEYILLDILYDDSPYGENLNDLPIESSFTKTKGENGKVMTPTIEAILGDKLTAFAPNTTGVPYGQGKAMEIIKQLYDIDKIFDHVKSTQVVREVFDTAVKRELTYRGLSETARDVLSDIFQTSLCMATRGKDGKGSFEALQNGIRSIRNYIHGDTFHIGKTMVPAAKAAYLAMLIQYEQNEIAKFQESESIKEWEIGHPLNTKLNKLKKTNPEAFFYWYKAYLLIYDH